MQEGRWATRLLNEIGAARAAIAAGYLNLWRSGGRPGEEGLEETPRAGNPEEVRTAREPSSETEQP